MHPLGGLDGAVSHLHQDADPDSRKRAAIAAITTTGSATYRPGSCHDQAPVSRPAAGGGTQIIVICAIAGPEPEGTARAQIEP